VDGETWGWREQGGLSSGCSQEQWLSWEREEEEGELEEEEGEGVWQDEQGDIS